MKKAKIAKFIRNTLISVGVLLLLSVGGGVAYTWYMGQNSDENSPAMAVPVEAAVKPVIKHVQPAANAKVGASVQMLTSPITPGSNASITVKTSPEAECTITVVYNKVPSKDSGLGLKIADEYGMVSWAWTVEGSVPLGKWPVTVTCTFNKKSAVVQGDLVVAKQADQ